MACATPNHCDCSVLNGSRLRLFSLLRKPPPEYRPSEIRSVDKSAWSPLHDCHNCQEGVLRSILQKSPQLYSLPPCVAIVNPNLWLQCMYAFCGVRRTCVGTSVKVRQEAEYIYYDYSVPATLLIRGEKARRGKKRILARTRMPAHARTFDHPRDALESGHK